VPEHVDFFEAVVTVPPDDADHTPPRDDPARARVARARDVADGDLILAAVSPHGADYFNTPYTAHPRPYDPACRCGVCCRIAHEPDDVIVLSSGHPWSTCDPWRADALALVIPAASQPDRMTKK
jgi:uroporphyrinogen-III synthase